ncbi:Transcription initiation factor IIB [Mortierella sp. AM989]|nr:Transcription initiation factor IIB [Mortierella sp. AM989]
MGPGARYHHPRSAPFSPAGQPSPSNGSQPHPHIAEQSPHTSSGRNLFHERPPPPPSQEQLELRPREDRIQGENVFRDAPPPRHGYGQAPPPGPGQYPAGGPAVPPGHAEEMFVDTRQQALAARQPHHAHQFSQEQMHMRPQSPHGVYPPTSVRDSEHLQAQDDRLLQHRRGMSTVDIADRPHLGMEQYHGREHEPPVMERGPFEGRPMYPANEQQRPAQVPPGYPGGSQEAPVPSQHLQHRRHPSGPVMHDGSIAPPIGYIEPRDRVAYERGDPRHVAPGQRPQSSFTADQRGPPSGQHYPNPTIPEHDPRQSQFVGHERSESFPDHPQVHPPTPTNHPDVNALGPPGPGIEDSYPQHRTDMMRGHPGKNRSSLDGSINAPRPSSITQHEPSHAPIMRQAPDPRHPEVVSPTSQQFHPQQPGYPPDVAHPQVPDSQSPYPRPTSQPHSYNPDLRRGPDGYHSEDQQRGNGPHPFPESAQGWPPRNSTPSRENWDSMDRRMDSAPPEYADRPVMNMKVIPQPDHDIPVHASVPNMPHPNQTMGRQGYVNQPGVISGGEMGGRQNFSPPAAGPVRDTPPGSTRGLSPDLTSQPDRVRKPRKTKGKPGVENGRPLEVNTVTLDYSAGRQTPNSSVDMAQEQQPTVKRMGRKPKSENDKRDAINKPWNVITPESHRRSISSHQEAPESVSSRPTVEIRDKVQFGMDQSRVDERPGSAQMAMQRSDMDSTAVEQGIQIGSFPEGTPLPSRPGYEHQRQASAQYGLPSVQYSPTAEDFENFKPRQRQQHQQVLQQNQQRPVHFQNPQHPQHQSHSPQYARQQGPESLGPAPDMEAQRVDPGKTPAPQPSMARSSKGPEVAQHIEEDAATALVNIQHVNRYQSPDSAAHLEQESYKKMRMESPSRPIESYPDHPHCRPVFPSPDGGMKGHTAPRGMQPASHGRGDLDEQGVAIILQEMSQPQQEMEAEELKHQGPVLHHLQPRYIPRSPSPRGPVDSQNHRGSYMQNIQGEDPQQNDHSPPGHHQLTPQQMAHEQRLHMQLQHEQMQRHHQQAPQPVPPRQGVSPQPFVRAPGQPNIEQPTFGPHRIAVESEQNARAHQSSLGGPAGHPQQAHYDPHPGYVGDDYERYRNSAGFPAEGKDRGDLARHQPLPADSPVSRQTNAPHEANHWGADSTTHSRKVTADTSPHGHQQSPQQPLYPPQYQSLPPHQQHQPHYPPPPSHQQSYPPEQRPDGPLMNQRQSTQINGNGMAMNVQSTMMAGTDQGEAGLVSASTTVLPKPKTTKAKNKPKKTSLDTLEVHKHVQEFDGRIEQGSYDGNSSSVNASPTSSRPRFVKREESIHDRAMLLDGNSSNVPSLMGPDTAPDRLLFGSGMILIRGSAPFPPPRLSIKTGRNYGPGSEPGSAKSASTATPMSATPMSATPMSATPMSANSVKNKRTRMALEIGETQSGETTEPPQQPQSTKTEQVKPRSPPLPMTPTKSKGVNRSKKGSGSSGSIDVDFERSNQITRPQGPAWLTAGSTSTASPSTGSSNIASTTIAAAQTKVSDMNVPANSSGPRRRLPLSSPTSTSENEKRKPKRIKIEEKDVRQVQRSSSLLADMTDGEKKDDSIHEGPSSQGSNSSKRSYTKRSGPSKDGNDRDLENGGGLDVEDEDEVLEEGERNGGNCSGAIKRRSPDDDEDGEGDDDTNTTGGGSGGRGGSNGDADGQGRGSAGNGGRKNMKRKSNSNLSCEGSTKKTKGVSPDTSFTTVKDSLPANESAIDGQAKLGRPRKQPKSNKKIKERSLSITNGTADSEAEIEYLPMEDDIECPQMFGIDDIKGLTSEDEVDDDEDRAATDGQETESESKTANIPSGSRKASYSSTKAGEASDIPDDIQKQGREWVSKLSMPESAWEESYKTYERVKRLKELKNRQPVRKRDAILAAILLIICRDQGSPRTFSEVCAASGVKRGDVGSYYRLMQKILKPSMNSNASARDTDAEAFMTRWCESLSLSPQVRQAAVHVFSIANTLNLTSGKCPSSVGAAAIYLCIYAWNEARRLANCQRYQCSGCQCLTQSHPGLVQDHGCIKKEAKDVAVAVGVVSATLMGCYKNLAPEKEKLIPPEFLQAAIEGI